MDKKNELHIQSYADLICIVSTTYGYPAISITSLVPARWDEEGSLLAVSAVFFSGK